MRLNPSPAPRFLPGVVLGCALTLVALLLSVVAPVFADSPNDRLGIVHVGSVDRQQPAVEARRYERATSVGAGWTRWVFYWHEIQSSEAAFDFAPQERVVNADLNAGLKIDAVLMGTPGWCATSSGPLAGTSTPRNLSLPIFTTGDTATPGAVINKDNYWARFVYETVSRFKGRVDVWEIWNEPDMNPLLTLNNFGFWTGSVQDYYRLLKVAYIAAKQADPNATVMLGGMAYYPDKTFLKRLYEVAKKDPSAAANGYYFDATAWHWYGRSRALYDMVNATRAELLAPFGAVDKPYWVNEMGVPVWNDSHKTPSSGRNEPFLTSGTATEQASYVWQSFAYGLAAGVDKMLWFQLYDDQNADPYGLVRNDDQARPAHTAYGQASSYFRDVTSASLSSQGSADLVTIYAGGDKITALWNTQGKPVTATVEASTPSAILVAQPTEAKPAGSTQWIGADNGRYSVTLPGATARNGSEGDFTIGGLTYLIVEQGVSDPHPGTIGRTSATVPVPSTAVTSTLACGATVVAQPGQVTNGDFSACESLAGWTTAGKTPAVVAPLARDGKAAAVLGQQFVADRALLGGSVSSISQTVAIPASGNPSLAFDLQIDTAQPKPVNLNDVRAYDRFEVYVTGARGSKTYLLTGYQPADWTAQSLDLSAWRGQTVQIVLAVWQSSPDYPTVARVANLRIADAPTFKVYMPSLARGAESQSAAGSQSPLGFSPCLVR